MQNHPLTLPCYELQETLEELQLGRSLLQRQAEAAMKDADSEIKLNKEQYEHCGRLLVHVKARPDCKVVYLMFGLLSHIKARPDCKAVCLMYNITQQTAATSMPSSMLCSH